MRLTFALVTVLACGGTVPTVELPASVVDKAFCALDAMNALPSDPEKATALDAKNAARRWLNCDAADAGAR